MNDLVTGKVAKHQDDLRLERTRSLRVDRSTQFELVVDTWP